MSPITPFRRLAGPVAACALLLSACGSDDTAGDLPSLGGSDAAASGSVTTTTVDPEEAAQDFVACLREQGLEVADPQVDSDGRIDMRSIFESAGLDPRSEDMRTAMDECRDTLANAGFGPSEEDRAAREESMLAFTSCLRDEGLDVGDLDFEGPGFGGPPDGGEGSAAGGLPGRDGSSNSTDTSVAGDDSAATTAEAPTPPQRPDGPMSQEGRTRFLAERLDLDPDDPAVTAAFEACSSQLEAIAPPGGPGGPGGPNGTTTTTEA